MAVADALRSTNGNGNGASSDGTTPRVALGQLSVSGIRNPDGSIWPDEYLRELQDPIRRMEVFEEMGNDGAVGTALEARCQDVYSANWELATEDKSEQGATILEWVKGEIEPWIEDLLRWLAEGPLQYGFVGIEKVYDWKDAADGERRLGLSKLAHLRQVTCEIHITETGELDYIQQHAFDGRRQRDPKIPVEKLIFRCLKLEGANYYGTPPLRKVYKEWNYKRQLEKINVAHFDRFGIGIPVVTEPEGGLSEPDRKLVDSFIQNLRAGLYNRLRLPFGAKVDILTGKGELAGAELEWVQNYESRIQKIVLTQGVDLGTTDTGSRAVGETFADQLQGAVQADAENIAAIILEQLIKPLVDLNFDTEIYPQYSPSARAKATTTLFTNIKTAKDAGILTPRPEDEVDIRDRLGLPSVDLETLKAEKEQRQQQAAAIAAAGNPTPGSPASSADQSGRPPAAPNNRPVQRVAAARDDADATSVLLLRQLAYTVAPGGPTAAIPGETTHRTPDGDAWTARILRPDVLLRELDLQAARATSEVQDALRAIDEDLAQQAETAAADGAQGLRDAIPRIAVPDRLRKRLRATLLTAAQRSRSYGESTVYQEIVRQIVPEGVGPQRSPRYPAIYPPMGVDPATAFTRQLSRVARLLGKVWKFATSSENGPHPRDLQLEAEVDRIVEDEIDRREGSTRAALGTALAQAIGAGEALARIVQSLVAAALLSLTTGRTQSNVQSVVNVGFGIGRSDAADAVNAAAASATGDVLPLPDNRVVAPDGTVSRTVTDPDTGDTTTAPTGERVTPPSGGGGGRSGLVDANGDPIELRFKVYSAVMDLGTCDECTKWDGAVFPIDYPEDLTGVQAPNPRCEGGYSRCRCVWIYVTDQELPANVGPSKGPQPLSQAAEADRVITTLRQQFETKIAELRAEMTKPAQAPQPITLNLTIEAPKSGTSKRVEITKPDGTKVVGDVTEVPNA